MQSPSRLNILFFKIMLWLLSFSLLISFNSSLLLSLLILINSLLLSLFCFFGFIGFQSYFSLILFLLLFSSISKSAHWNLLILLIIVYEFDKKELSSFNQAFIDGAYYTTFDWAIFLLSVNNVVILKYLYIFILY
jgi:hypothetical protein